MGTYHRALDAVEQEDLNHDDRGADAVEVDDVESLKPALAEEVADYGACQCQASKDGDRGDPHGRSFRWWGLFAREGNAGGIDGADGVSGESSRSCSHWCGRTRIQ
jgi:hypothetical protein